MARYNLGETWIFTLRVVPVLSRVRWIAGGESWLNERFNSYSNFHVEDLRGETIVSFSEIRTIYARVRFYTSTEHWPPANLLSFSDSPFGPLRFEVAEARRASDPAPTPGERIGGEVERALEPITSKIAPSLRPLFWLALAALVAYSLFNARRLAETFK